jgi:hypothetical protein
MLVRMSYFAIDWIKKWTQELISTRNSEGGQYQSWVNKFFQDLLFCHSTILLVLMTTTSESTVLWGIISISNCTQNQYRKGQHKKMASFVETLSLGKKNLSWKSLADIILYFSGTNLSPWIRLTTGIRKDDTIIRWD